MRVMVLFQKCDKRKEKQAFSSRAVLQSTAGYKRLMRAADGRLSDDESTAERESGTKR